MAVEMSVADLGAPDSPGYSSEYSGKVEAWARLVAENRVI